MTTRTAIAPTLDDLLDLAPVALADSLAQIPGVELGPIGRAVAERMSAIVQGTDTTTIPERLGAVAQGLAAEAGRLRPVDLVAASPAPAGETPPPPTAAPIATASSAAPAATDPVPDLVLRHGRLPLLGLAEAAAWGCLHGPALVALAGDSPRLVLALQDGGVRQVALGEVL